MQYVDPILLMPGMPIPMNLGVDVACFLILAQLPTCEVRQPVSLSCGFLCRSFRGIIFEDCLLVIFHSFLIATLLLVGLILFPLSR